MSVVARAVADVWPSVPTIEGAGVHLRRAFGYDHVPRLDPFLMMDDFRSGTPAHYLAGFPWHPHRGIETITYMLEGEVEHGDSMGNQGVIRPGEVQWMTAGSGIIHQEMPRGDASGRMGGFQLWANLPASHKMMPPRYRALLPGDIPTVELPSGGSVRVVAGKLGEVTGPVTDIVTAPEYLDIALSAGVTFEHPVPAGHTALAYVFEGAVSFGTGRDSWVTHEHLALFEREGEVVTMTTREAPVRLLLLSGQPLGEPVAWRGPIVMNTREELRLAFEEYERGTFVKGG